MEVEKWVTEEGPRTNKNDMIHDCPPFYVVLLLRKVRCLLLIDVSRHRKSIDCIWDGPGWRVSKQFMIAFKRIRRTNGAGVGGGGVDSLLRTVCDTINHER